MSHSNARLVVLSVRGFASWAPYLIDDDCSGLDQSEISAADAWFEEVRAAHLTANAVIVSGCSDPYFASLNGVKGDCADYVVHVHVAAQKTVTLSSDTIQQALVALHKTECTYRDTAFGEEANGNDHTFFSSRRDAVHAARKELIAALKKQQGT